MNIEKLRAVKESYLGIHVPKHEVQKQWDSLSGLLPVQQTPIMYRPFFRYAIAFACIFLLVFGAIVRLSQYAKPGTLLYGIKTWSASVNKKLTNTLKTTIETPTILLTPVEKITQAPSLTQTPSPTQTIGNGNPEKNPQSDHGNNAPQQNQQDLKGEQTQKNQQGNTSNGNTTENNHGHGHDINPNNGNSKGKGKD